MGEQDWSFPCWRTPEANVAQLNRHSRTQFVVFQADFLQESQLPQLAGDRLLYEIVIQPKDFKRSQVADFGWYVAFKQVEIQGQRNKVCERTD